MTEETARPLLDQFKKCKVSLRKFGRRVGYHGDGLALAFRRFFPCEYEELLETKAARRDLRYRTGRSFEYAVRDYLRRHGWPIVMRSPQSRGAADLIALRTGQIVLVQCKAGGSITLNERAALIELAESVGATAIVADREPDKARGMRLRRTFVAGWEPWAP